MQEKNESNSFFDLYFEGEIDGVAAAVASPEGLAGLHGEAHGLVLIEAAGSGIAADHELDEALGTPHAAQGGAAVFHVYLAEAHTVDIH